MKQRFNPVAILEVLALATVEGLAGEWQSFIRVHSRMHMSVHCLQ
jgi:hypothetical protein